LWLPLLIYQFPLDYFTLSGLDKIIAPSLVVSFRLSRLAWWLVEPFTFVACTLFVVVTGLSDPSPGPEKSVLVLYGERGDFGANGRSTADLALKALRGQWVPFGAPETESRNPLVINWQALQKAGLHEWRVPKDAQVRFRPPGLWETHRTFILIVAGAIIFQAVLITGLVVERFLRRRAEDRFRLVVEASPNGIVLVNEGGQIVFVNPYAEKLFGYGREELIGQTIEILVPERFRAEYPAPRAQFLAAPLARKMGAGRELFGRRKDGSEFPVEIGINPIQSQGGIIVLAAIVDLSARKQAEAEVRQHREELAHFSRVETLGEMAGSLAHELNQPLTGIMNNANAARRFIAKGRADMPKLDGLFKCVVADARRAGEIIHGIRNMVRKGEGARSSVNLNSIIADVASLIHSDALERHCAVATEPDPGLPLVKGNPVLLQQVLLNIVINAFDAMHKTPIAERRVLIRTECESGRSVRVSVRDFGTGLPAENPQRIFEQFFSTKTDGLGMGLTIARSIIASHGGELAAANAEGGGACVYFSLPAIAEDLA
jgi:PAS domain S-box-containing protein